MEHARARNPFFSRRTVVLGLAAVIVTGAAVAIALARRDSPSPVPADSVTSPTPATATGTRTPIDIVIPAGPTRADTLRELERQAGIVVTIPWLPAGLEVAGGRATIHCLPTCTEDAFFDVRGNGAPGFALAQTNRPTSNSAGVAVPGAPPGFAFYRGEGTPGFVTWTLTNATHTYTLAESPAFPLDPETVLRILLGMAR